MGGGEQESSNLIILNFILDAISSVFVDYIREIEK